MCILYYQQIATLTVMASYSSFCAVLLLSHLYSLTVCLSIVTMIVIDMCFIVCLNFENFSYLFNGIVSYTVVIWKIESIQISHWIESLSSLANRPSLVIIMSVVDRWGWHQLWPWLHICFLHYLQVFCRQLRHRIFLLQHFPTGEWRRIWWNFRNYERRLDDFFCNIYSAYHDLVVITVG